MMPHESRSHGSGMPAAFCVKYRFLHTIGKIARIAETATEGRKALFQREGFPSTPILSCKIDGGCAILFVHYCILREGKDAAH